MKFGEEDTRYTFVASVLGFTVYCTKAMAFAFANKNLLRGSIITTLRSSVAPSSPLITVNMMRVRGDCIY